MVNININIQKKDLWLFSAITMFLIGVGFVIAYNANMNSGAPPVMGHSAGEINVNDSSGKIVSLQTYIDKGGGCSFGAWQDVTSVALAGAVQGPAISDGFVLAKGTRTNHVYLYGYTDSNDASTERIHHSDLYAYPSPNTLDEGLMMPVKKGDYWKVTGATDYVYWLSFNC